MDSISRRKFIQLTSMTGSFLAIGYMPQTLGSEKLMAQILSDPETISLNQFISIGTDNSIILFNIARRWARELSNLSQ